MLLLFIFLLPACAKDKRKYRLPRVDFGTPAMKWTEDDSLSLSFTAELSERLRGNTSLHLQPLVVYNSGDTVRYPEIVYATPIWRNYARRRVALGLDEEDPNGISVVLKSKKTPRTKNYVRTGGVTATRHGRLVMHQWIETCCETYPLKDWSMELPALKSVYKVDSILPPPVAVVSVPLFEANISFIEPKAEEVKEREANATIRINYPVDQAEILPDFAGNARELARVDSIFAPLQNGTTYTIQSIAITGHTSPEDTYAHNLDLSQRRAESMIDYLRKSYRTLSNTPITAEGLGEDWEGLRQMVAGSDMPMEQRVLDIIEHVDLFEGREKKLMELNNGEPYRYMLRYFFPPLRRMELKVAYHVRQFTAEEAGRMLNERPQDLGAEEIFQAARRLNSDSTIVYRRQQYGKEYDIALRYNPGDVAANINASSAALIRGDLAQARTCLDRVKGNVLAANNLGIYFWLCGQPEQARLCFERAMEADPVRAKYNLQQMDAFNQQIINGQ